MIFSEVYGAYYNIMADILKIAVTRPPTKEEIDSIIREKGFAETNLFFGGDLYEDRYKLMTRDGKTPIRHSPSMPLTTAQKRWLKAISMDPRFTLFGISIEGIEDVKPLFTPDMTDVFDKYADGDPYEDPSYREHFAMVLKALREDMSLELKTISGKGKRRYHTLTPSRLEYSEKDDKFRVIGMEGRYILTVNINRILEARLIPRAVRMDKDPYPDKKEVTLMLYDTRKALDRVLLHFAHFEKEAVHLGGKRYKITLRYCPDDETEILIRLMSFGPLIRVVSPEPLKAELKKRVDRQHDLLSL
ncbi:MAG: WYL domain-containing protein [Saccharofermentans sp.]|nr:WYL domain-containing protein [Saccharofermentans sp.]